MSTKTVKKVTPSVSAEPVVAASVQEAAPTSQPQAGVESIATPKAGSMVNIRGGHTYRISDENGQPFCEFRFKEYPRRQPGKGKNRPIIGSSLTIDILKGPKDAMVVKKHLVLGTSLDTNRIWMLEGEIKDADKGVSEV